MVRKLTWNLIVACMLTVGASGVSRADAAAATVTPATGGGGVPLIFGSAAFDLATVGYAHSEFFFEGTADAYSPVGPLTNDGSWTVTPFSPAAYKTRMVVNRPADPSDFNGTVVVEWLNVSGGADASPDWQHMHVELLRRGYAWVGVSAQFVGVNQLKNGGPAPGDPGRYGSLVHPGDSHSYDIFSQAGQAVRDQAALVLGGLSPERLIAVGESQSAGRLTTYIDAAHPVVEVFDGFIVHSRSSSGSPLSQAPLTSVPTPNPTFLRDDLDVPVLVFQTENDLGGLAARQDDGPLFRLWEVAGTAHFDYYGLVQAQDDVGERETVADWFDSMRNPTANPSPNFSCGVPINSGPQTFVMRAALRAMNHWIAWGLEPPEAPRLVVDGSPGVYATDELGNALGGIRTPAVDAPVARLNGLGQTGGGGFCFLFGITVPLTEEQLADRYHSHGLFTWQWAMATLDARRKGFLLREDARDLIIVGAQSDILQ